MGISQFPFLFLNNYPLPLHFVTITIESYSNDSNSLEFSVWSLRDCNLLKNQKSKLMVTNNYGNVKQVTLRCAVTPNCDLASRKVFDHPEC